MTLFSVRKLLPYSIILTSLFHVPSNASYDESRYPSNRSNVVIEWYRLETGEIFLHSPVMGREFNGTVHCDESSERFLVGGPGKGLKKICEFLGIIDPPPTKPLDPLPPGPLRPPKKGPKVDPVPPEPPKPKKKQEVPEGCENVACIPPIGTYGYRLDFSDTQHHYCPPGTHHIHHFVRKQRPSSQSCQCDWDEFRHPTCLGNQDVPDWLSYCIEVPSTSPRGKKNTRGASNLYNDQCGVLFGLSMATLSEDVTVSNTDEIVEEEQTLLVPEDDPIFEENFSCPSNPCDSVNLICGTELANAGINTVLALTGTGAFNLRQCAMEHGINLPFDGINIIGVETYEDLLGIVGDKICDVLGCFPPMGPLGPAIAACSCYMAVKGALNCEIARLECEMAQNERPLDHPLDGPCAYSSVMACVNGRPTTDEEINIQCRNMARQYRYRDGTDDFDQCVLNCVDLTKQSRDGFDCEHSTLQSNGPELVAENLYH